MNFLEYFSFFTIKNLFRNFSPLKRRITLHASSLLSYLMNLNQDLLHFLRNCCRCKSLTLPALLNILLRPHITYTIYKIRTTSWLFVWLTLVPSPPCSSAFLHSKSLICICIRFGYHLSPPCSSPLLSITWKKYGLSSSMKNSRTFKWDIIGHEQKRVKELKLWPFAELPYQSTTH